MWNYRFFFIVVKLVNKNSILYDLVFENILPLYNKQKNTWMLGNTRFISRVENDIQHSK